MKIAFVDLSEIDFNPLTPETQPLGGMQSGVCYLSRELQKRGHDVLIFNGSSTEGVFDGVQAVNFRRHFSAARHDCDAYISISCAGLTLRPFTKGKPLILFTGHSSLERSMQALAQPGGEGLLGSLRVQEQLAGGGNAHDIRARPRQDQHHHERRLAGF